MATHNPTRTLSIEKAWNREINKRWARFRKATISQLKSINEVSVVANSEIPFSFDPSLINQYMIFYQEQIDSILMGNDSPPNWQAQYQLDAYIRGLKRTTQQLEAQGVQQTLNLDVSGIEIPQSIIVSNLPPAHNAGLEFLYTRSYESLKGWTDSMARETRSILVDSFNQGLGINKTVSKMVERQNVSRSRARVIARTETIQAYQRASTTEVQRAESLTGEEIGMRWVTALDSRVRHLHASWHGTITTPEENFNRINQSPWNCRCAQVPVVHGTNTKIKREKFAEERKRLLMLERR